jgi:uncharacterized protein YyaL (SSP411 family)
MERESFEDPETAILMNRLFVNVKIDREERPDLDASYQTAVARLSRGQGGWPLTVFATPDGHAFAGGTYFPKEASYGLPSFKQVLQLIANEYEEKQESIKILSKNTLTTLSSLYTFHPLSEKSEEYHKAKDTVLNRLQERFDQAFGGFGFQPKFPQVTDLRFLLEEGVFRKHDKALIKMVTKTLDNLADGGIYDQIGYGFHRYSVDRKWLIPHFEKMLYDNAQLLLIYLEAYQVTTNVQYARIAEEIIEYLLREMHSNDNLFYSSQDADSEGKEGVFFVWKDTEIIDVLGIEKGEWFNHHFGVFPDGNFEEGLSILHVTPILRETLQKEEITIGELNSIKKKLLKVRNNREKPFLNDNAIVSWNALVIYSLGKASFILNNPKYLAIGSQTLNSIVKLLFNEETKRLRRNYRKKANGWGFADDYVLLIQSFLFYFALTGKRNFLEKAELFQKLFDRDFWDEDKSGYYFSGSWQTDTYIREKPVVTFSIPNANSIALENLIRLYHYTGNQKYLKRADKQVSFLLGWFKEYSTFNGETLSSLSLYYEKPVEIIIFLGEDQDANDSILNYLRSTFIPHSLPLIVTRENFAEVKDYPNVQDKLNYFDEDQFVKTTAFICRDLTCSVPLYTGTEIQQYLEK